MKFRKVRYRDLNARQQEAYNFQKISARLADFGFSTLRLSDDWEGADFIAQHADGRQFLKVQLKGRLALAKKYRGKGLLIGFCDEDDWYLVPHDEMLDWVLANTGVGKTESWRKKGVYHFSRLSAPLRKKLRAWRLGDESSSVE